jgi:chromosome segregation ATPase
LAMEEERGRWQSEISKRDDAILQLEHEIRQLEQDLQRAEMNISFQSDSVMAAKTQAESQARQVGQLTQDLAQQDSEVKLLQKRLNDATVSMHLYINLSPTNQTLLDN